MKFVGEEESLEFQKKLQEVLNYLKNQNMPHHYKTVTTLLNDNINMFNRIKELEDGKANGTEEE